MKKHEKTSGHSIETVVRSKSSEALVFLQEVLVEGLDPVRPHLLVHVKAFGALRPARHTDKPASKPSNPPISTRFHPLFKQILEDFRGF